MSLITQVQEYLKDIFANGFADEATRIHPMLDSMAKPDELGLDYIYLVKYGNAQNIALGDDNLAAAQAVGTSSKALKFAMQPSIMTGEALLPVTQLEASLKGNTYAFGSLIETEVDGTMDEFYTRRGFQLYRDSYGARGQIASISTNTLTLVNAFDAINFMQGMPLNASTSENGSSPQAGSATVLSVDIDDGTITVDNASGITSLAANMYLFATTEISELGLEGFSVSTPLVAPTSGDSFRGQDRSVDPSRLAGSRLTASQANGTLEMNIVKVLTRIRQVGGQADFSTMNSERAMEVRTRLGAKVRFDPGGDATYGFSSFMFDTPLGPIKVVDDPDCPTTAAWVGHSGSHKLPTLDAFVRIDESDGNWAIRKPSNNQIAVRIRSVGNYCQPKPRNFGVVPIS
ncbi:MAG TPA: hypothetical protein VHZ95_22180 [Polyangiales bacterium]|nr:hypothetical protein [Polyangiales bacterium]